MDRERIANERRSPQVQALASEYSKFLDYYENAYNYDFNSNGERFVLESMAKYNFSCVFDIGANVGDWALLAHQNFPNAKIHCFEIVKQICEILNKKTKSVSNITVNNFGLSDQAEEVKLKFCPTHHHVTSQIDYPLNLLSHPCDFEITTCSVICGDSYMQKQDIKHVDFMKIDVEGSEHRVLDGLKRAIKHRMIDVIQFEYGLFNILTKFLLYDFYVLFRNNGYRIGKIYPNYVDFREYAFIHEDFRGPNYLAVLEDRTDLISSLQ